MNCNTTVPIREFRRCYCHGWRIDECPNASIALWAKAAEYNPK